MNIDEIKSGVNHEDAASALNRLYELVRDYADAQERVALIREEMSRCYYKVLERLEDTQKVICK